MSCLYQSTQLQVTAHGDHSVYRPVQSILDQINLCGLTIFSTQAGLIIQPRVDIRPCVTEFFTIGQVVSGNGWFWDEKKGRLPIATHQLFFIRNGQPHDLAAGKSGMVVDRICCCGPNVISLLEAGNLACGIHESQTPRRLVPIIEHASLDTPEHQLRATSGLMNLLADLTAEQPLHDQPAETLQIDRLCAEFKRSPEKWWDGPQMAAFCNMSEAHLRRLFKAQTGLSPKTYHDQIRIEKAQELLRNGFSVRIVSEILGYSDPYHFSRRFKAILGYSPSDYPSP